MRKLNFFTIALLLASLSIQGTPSKTECIAATEEQYYIGGMTAGFHLNAGGIEIMELSSLQTQSGEYASPAKDAGLRVGDKISSIDGMKVRDIEELNRILALSSGNPLLFSMERGGEIFETSITPIKDKSGTYKIGILIRDTLSGIGTITYIERTTRDFGALGHGIATDDESRPITLSDAKVFECSVVGVTKGSRGKAGELRGLFLNGTAIGVAQTVCETGLYGKMEKSYDLSQIETVDIAPLSEAGIGKAIIYSTVDGTKPQKYDIAIAKVDADNRDNKNFVVKITDQKLISQTGGIVQGMSGSPIIQNGKLVGAITHVFLNDPTRGYGIGIEKMIDSCT